MRTGAPLSEAIEIQIRTAALEGVVDITMGLCICAIARIDVNRYDILVADNIRLEYSSAFVVV